MLRRVRKDAGLSQDDLASRLGQLQSWVSRMERGQNPIEIPQLVAWFNACGESFGLQWGSEAAPVVDPLANVPPEDRALLLHAAPLLATAPGARRRLALELELWAEESTRAEVHAAIARTAGTLSSALGASDNDALRILRERVVSDVQERTSKRN